MDKPVSPQGSALDRVTDFALGIRPDQVPADTLARAALLALDTIGVWAASAPMQAGRIARDTAVRFYGAGTSEDAARIGFDGRTASVVGAAFAAASQIDNLDAHDGYNPSKGHIGVAVVPALFALAEAQPDLSGPEALAALVVGYEVSGRAATALHSTVSDYHTSGAWNALGVAAMAARLRGQDPQTLRQALGIAEYHGPRSQMMREIANPTMLHDGSGMGALVGLSAAVMAEQGFDGAPAVTVESAEVASHWADLGTIWQPDLQYIKPYPTCRWAHAPIDGARALASEFRITHDQIAQIRISTFANAAALWPGMPETTSQAQYSLPFVVASYLVHGQVGLDQIDGAGLRDPDVARLVAATEMIVDPRHEARYPDHGRWADVSITLQDGRVLQSGDMNASGGPEAPWGTDEIVKKYTALASPVLGTERADTLCHAVLSLTGTNATVASVADCLYVLPSA